MMAPSVDKVNTAYIVISCNYFVVKSLPLVVIYLNSTGDENVPILVDALRNEVVISVACGDGQTIALTAHGEVWGWGCYKDKEGKKFFNPCSTAANPVKDIKKQQNEPIKISGLPHIVEIACGSSFCLALCSTGHVYSWGLGECGELGRRVGPLKVKGLDADGEEDMVYDLPAILNQHLTPQLMCVSSSGGRDGSDRGTPIENVKTIGCGSYHSLVVTIGAKAYSCGLNNYGQLGLTAEVGKSSAGVNEDTESRPLLQAMLFFRDVPLLAVSGGVHHSLVLTADNRLFTFGRGDSGQLGTPQMEGKSAGAFSSQPLPVLLPSSVDKFAKVVSFSCGGNHNLVLLSNKDVYSWGYGDMLALGHGDERDENTPRRLNFSKSKIGNISVSKVAGGGQHSALIGEVLSTK